MIIPARTKHTEDSAGTANYDNLIQVNHGTLVLGHADTGVGNGADFHSNTDFVVEKGKLEVAAGDQNHKHGSWICHFIK